MKKRAIIAALCIAALCVAMIILAACGNKHEHSYSWTVTVPATCTSGGVEEGVCAECGDKTTRQTPINPEAHVWDEANATVTKQPTCTGEGAKLVTCTLNAAHTQTQAIPKTGHTKGDLVDFVAPTCTEEGKDVYKCSVCHNNFDVAVPALGHVWNSAVTITEPTCTVAGKQTAVCEVCGEEGRIEIPALGHDFEPYYTIQEAADFEKDGLKWRNCSRCGEHTDETKIPKLDKDTPTAYQFRLVRPNGELIKVAGAELEVFDSDGVSQTTGTFRNGTVTIALPPAEYTVKLTGLPQGYSAEAQYAASWQNLVVDITLRASLIESAPDESSAYIKGSVMHNYTFKTLKTNKSEAQTVNLKDLLSRYELVMLNFWDVSCSFCEYEFPGMEKAYGQYKDKVYILAVDDPDGMSYEETEGQVIEYFNSHRLTFAVTMDNLGLAERFGLAGKNAYYPTTVIIDREGVVCEVHSSAYVNPQDYEDVDYSAQLFATLFERFLPEPAAQTAAAAQPTYFAEKRRYI